MAGLLDKTDLPEEAIAEYSGEVKATAPVTLSTYQILTYRPNRDADFPHFGLFQARLGTSTMKSTCYLPFSALLPNCKPEGVLTATLIRRWTRVMSLP